MAHGIWIRKRPRSRPPEVWIVYRDGKGRRHREKIGPDTTQARHLAKERLAQRQCQIAEGKAMMFAPASPPDFVKAPGFAELKRERPVASSPGVLVGWCL